MINRVLLLAFSTVACVTYAQSPSTPTPATPAALGGPAHNCAKPGPLPGRLASTNQVKSYNGEVKTYQECLQAFVKAQSELVKMHSEVGNAAVNEYNDFITEMKLKKEAAK